MAVISQVLPQSVLSRNKNQQTTLTFQLTITNLRRMLAFNFGGRKGVARVRVACPRGLLLRRLPQQLGIVLHVRNRSFRAPILPEKIDSSESMVGHTTLHQVSRKQAIRNSLMTRSASERSPDRLAEVCRECRNDGDSAR
jgi:hypothetical protein